MITAGFVAGIFRANEVNSLRALIPSGSGFGQALIYFGAFFLVALGFFTWAIIFHRQRRHRYWQHSFPKLPSKHRRQSGDRTRNRTLAEAGGLPPVRAEKQPFSPA
jgi:hypothetical protein